MLDISEQKASKMQMRLTDLAIQKLGPGTYSDIKTPAFGIRVGKNRKTWFYVHTTTRQRMGIGHYPALSLSEARNLRTEQVVYIRYKSEIYRLSVKGASLSGTEETTNFYQYLTSFANAEVNWYETTTRLVPTKGGDGHRSYYFIDFQAGDALSEAQKEQVYENIEYVHKNCTQVDALSQNMQTTRADQTPAESGSSMPDYPEEEVNPDDIPF
jgi:hypothetical protein